jgi:putative hydrolase of the HAD superfamily
VVRAVLFDFYGTLAHWSGESHGYTVVFAQFGCPLPDDVLGAYMARDDGVAHQEHSANAATYEAWVRSRLRDLTTACRVPAAECEGLIDALRAADQGDMVAYPEAAATLAALADAGFAIGVSSNWGWELDPFLEQVGLRHLVDAAVTSARAGARKPHPQMYAVSLAAVGVGATEAVFVGDSWGPDVEGPQHAGMAAVHLWRPAGRMGAVPPVLKEGALRISALDELLALSAFSR